MFVFCYDICVVELCDFYVIVQFIGEFVQFENLIYLLEVMFVKFEFYFFGEWLVVECMVGEVNGEVVVFVLFYMNFLIFLVKFGFYLEDFYVCFVYCCSGLGCVLIIQFVQFVCECGYGCFDWMVLDWNEDVICFYEKLGVEVMFEWCICCLIGDVLECYVDGDWFSMWLLLSWLFI